MSACGRYVRYACERMWEVCVCEHTCECMWEVCVSTCGRYVSAYVGGVCMCAGDMQLNVHRK